MAERSLATSELASDVTAGVREALNHSGLDGVAGVHYQNRYAGRALHGGERGGIPASDQEIDLIGDHSIHRIRSRSSRPSAANRSKVTFLPSM